MRSYSLDLRLKVVAADNRSSRSIIEIVAISSVGPTFFKKMLRLNRQGGDLSLLLHGGSHTPKLSYKHLQIIGAEVAKNNYATIQELREMLRRRAGRCEPPYCRQRRGTARPASQKV